MWQDVRRELNRLAWEVEPHLTLDLMADWTATVSSLVALRRALGPISTADPIALLATATTGAARTSGVKPVLAPSLHEVAMALGTLARDMPGHPGADDHHLRGRNFACRGNLPGKETAEFMGRFNDSAVPGDIGH